MVESIVPSIMPALAALELETVVARAGFLRCEGTRVLWQGARPSERGAATLLIDRAQFDRHALRAAAAAGGRIVLGNARARTRSSSGWRVAVDSVNGALGVEAAYVVDARGRDSRRRTLGVPTAAICGRWRVGHPQEMRVEALADAWLWGAPVADGCYDVAVFLDMHDCAGLRRSTREALYRSRIEQSDLLRFCARGELTGALAVRDATCGMAEDVVSKSSIKIGDRALGMDPLSSQGLQAALRSALHAGAVIHTILSSGDADAALAFYRDSIQRAAASHRRTTQEIYASQSRHDSAFWRSRSVEAKAGAQTPHTVADRNAAVRLCPRARVAEQPVVEGDVIARHPALSHPSLEHPVAWLSGVALTPLLRTLDVARAPAEILASWSGRVGPRAARRILDWLIDHGVVVGA